MNLDWVCQCDHCNTLTWTRKSILKNVLWKLKKREEKKKGKWNCWPFVIFVWAQTPFVAHLCLQFILSHEVCSPQSIIWPNPSPFWSLIPTLTFAKISILWKSRSISYNFSVIGLEFNFLPIFIRTQSKWPQFPFDICFIVFCYFHIYSPPLCHFWIKSLLWLSELICDFIGRYYFDTMLSVFCFNVISYPVAHCPPKPPHLGINSDLHRTQWAIIVSPLIKTQFYHFSQISPKMLVKFHPKH